MTETVAIILAVGTLLPLLTSIIQQPKWSDRTRTLVGVGVSVLAGLVTYVSQYGLDVSSVSKIVSVVVGVILAAATSYKSIWKTSGVAQRLEVATTRGEPDGDDYDEPVAPQPDTELLPDPDNQG